MAPIPGEVLVDKPGKGAFYATNLDLVLRTHGITHIVLTGITTDVCVHTTMREANDRGYECLILVRLHRRHRPGQPRRRAAHGDHAGRGLRLRSPTSTAVIEGTTTRDSVAAEPYPFTFDPRRTALVIIDMQRDFVEPGGFGETLGNDVVAAAGGRPAAAGGARRRPRRRA